MDFIKFLFPFDSIVNVVFISATFLVWIISLRHVSKVINKIKNALLSDNEETYSVEIKPAWERYRSTFLESGKTEYETEYFFTRKILFSDNSHLSSIISTVPGTLVGLGILGTFVGLSMGTANFDASNIEGIKQSIERLLAGMTTAFTTSVWGMALSILFTAIDNLFIEPRLLKAIKDFCDKNDKKYLMRTDDLEKYELNKMVEVFDKYLKTKDDKGNEITVINLIRNSIFELEQQTKALKSFSTDLADGIKISNETVISLGDKLGTTFTNKFNDELKPALLNINTAIEKLREEKSENAGQFANDIIAKLEGAISNITNNFQQSLSGSTINQINSLAATLTEISRPLNDLPTTLDLLISKFEKMMNDQQSNLKNAGSSISQETASMVEILNDEVEQTINRFGELTKQLAATINDSNIQQIKNSEVAKDLVEKSTTSSQEMTDTIYQLNLAYDKLTESIETFTSISTNIKDMVRSNSENSVSIKRASFDLINAMSNFVTENKQINQQQNENLSKATKLVEVYKGEFDELAESIQSVFVVLNDGLKSYQDVTKDTLNKYLASFSENLSKGAEHLNGSIEMLSGVIDDLTDRMDNHK